MPTDRLRDALRLLIEEGNAPDSVRREIGASWNRALGSGLRPENFDVGFDDDVDDGARLVTAARPVLNDLWEDLNGTGVAVILTDQRAHVVERIVGDGPLADRLDRISLAPGFVYAEGLVGTNAIGTALAQRGPSMVWGSEHFANALTSMACAAVPITDPGTGRVLGAIDLTCRAADSHPLLLALAARARRDIERRLLDDGGFERRLLLQRFLQFRRGAKVPLVLVDQQRMFTNAAADHLVSSADAPLLWQHASRVLSGVPIRRSQVVLSSGVSVSVTCETVTDGGVQVGALLRLTIAGASESTSPAPGRRSIGFGWESLTATETSVAALVADGFTNREVADQLFLSPYTVDSHLRGIYRKLGIRSRVQLTRAVLDGRAGRDDGA